MFNRLAVLADLLMVGAAFGIAYYIRDLSGGLTALRNYLWILLAVIPLWYFLLSYYGLYASIRMRCFSEIVSSLVKVHVIGGVISASIIYFVEPVGFCRGLFGIFLLTSFVFLTLEKASLKSVLSIIRKWGYNIRNILIIGTDEKALDFIRLLKEHDEWGLKIIGLLGPGKDLPVMVDSYAVLGTLIDLVSVCKAHTVDEVVFCVRKELFPSIEEYLRDMYEMGINVRMVLDFYDTPTSTCELSLFHGEIPMLTFYCKSFDASQLFLKRCLDIVGACVGLLITTILFPFIAIAIKLEAPGPLLFGQDRVGMNGRIFHCWKFRSMFMDAEERKQELMRLNEMKGAMFKIKDDPRVTKVGNFLRKTSLDELPQFWNVFKGEMSLVGTRPPTPDEVATYENWHRKRICIKPGITGLWQVSGRNQIQDFDDVVRLDLQYIDRWTIWLDIRILFKTLWVVFARKGSY